MRGTLALVAFVPTFDEHKSTARDEHPAGFRRLLFRLKSSVPVVSPMEAQLRLLLDANAVGESRVFGLESLAADPLFVRCPSVDPLRPRQARSRGLSGMAYVGQAPPRPRGFARIVRSRRFHHARWPPSRATSSLGAASVRSAREVEKIVDRSIEEEDERFSLQRGGKRSRGPSTNAIGRRFQHDLPTDRGGGDAPLERRQ